MQKLLAKTFRGKAKSIQLIVMPLLETFQPITTKGFHAFRYVFKRDFTCVYWPCTFAADTSDGTELDVGRWFHPDTRDALRNRWKEEGNGEEE